MHIGYFNAAWHDIKNSPGWFGRLLLLGLVGMIPIFGWIVVAGYLYGWARDIAWGIHAPLPARIFGDEDGRLYSRGFFVLVIGLVCSLIPMIVNMVGGIVTGMGIGFSSFTWSYHSGAFALPFGMMSGMVSLVFALLSFAALFAVSFFQWVGSMRMSVYGRLSAGFQLGKIWAMIRHDFGGILRIFGMSLLLSLGVGILLSVVLMAFVIALVLMAFVVTGGGMSYYSMADMPTAAAVSSSLLAVGAAVLIGTFALYLTVVLTVFCEMMVARALGYWTRQFDVPHWGGQDDPMPFERAAAENVGRPL